MRHCDPAAAKLRGVYKQSEYGRVILPLVALRRRDRVLEPTKAEVLPRHEALKGRVENVAPVLESVIAEALGPLGWSPTR